VSRDAGARMAAAKPMRIAYLTSRLPFPPIGGDRLRAYHFLRHLLRSHEVTLYAIGSPLRGRTDTGAPDLHGLEKQLWDAIARQTMDIYQSLE
jgi:hypothetical protein